MSTIENPGAWANIPSENVDPKYEKCRNITEEIYKRINITFQIKKLEMGAQSDVSDLSDQVDSNELSNETDLFACDKSSLTSSTDAEQLERGSAACEKYININNNEEQLKKAPVCKRPRKRFRKRIKKTQKQHRDSDGSSDEGPPLSLVAELGRPARGPRLVLLTADITKLKSPPDTKPVKKAEVSPKAKPDPKHQIQVSGDMLPIIPIVPIDFSQKTQGSKDSIKEDFKSSKCSTCSLPFRTERGLRRHMSITHQAETGERKRTEQRGKPA